MWWGPLGRSLFCIPMSLPSGGILPRIWGRLSSALEVLKGSGCVVKRGPVNPFEAVTAIKGLTNRIGLKWTLQLCIAS